MVNLFPKPVRFSLNSTFTERSEKFAFNKVWCGNIL